jgi:hypothetical protein
MRVGQEQQQLALAIGALAAVPAGAVAFSAKAADLLQSLDEESSSSIIEAFEGEEEKAELQELMTYAEDIAGSAKATGAAAIGISSNTCGIACSSICASSNIKCAGLMVRPPLNTTARCTTFSSSRTLPGHG